MTSTRPAGRRRPDAHRWARVVTLVPPWTKREFRAQYLQSFLGIGWSVVTPVVTLAGFGLLLTSSFGVTGDGVPYITFAWAGLVIWNYVANGVTRSCASLVQSADLVRRVSFPLEVAPISVTFATAVDLAIGFATLCGLMVLQGLAFSPTILLAIPVLAVVVLWAMGLGTACALVTTRYRDLVYVVAVVLRIGIFVTPVMYPVSDLPTGFAWVAEVNPIAVFIEAFRDVMFDRATPDWALLGIHGAIGAAVLALALWSAERYAGTIADVI